jgi:hypothetical protein
VNADGPRLGQSSAAFAMAGAVTLLFNTALTCVKDASAPLANFMASLTGNSWTAQGIADVVIFFGLGLVGSKTGLAASIAPNRLIAFLIVSAVLAGAGLLVWFAVF